MSCSRLDGTELRIASIGGELPLPVVAGGITQIPLRLQAAGVTARRGATSLAGVSGQLAADYFSGQGRQWITGTGRVAAATISYNGKEAGAVSGRLRFAERDAAADIDGTLFDGRLSAQVHFAPLDLPSRSDFTMSLRDARGENFAAVLPAGVPLIVKSGRLGVTVCRQS